MKRIIIFALFLLTTCILLSAASFADESVSSGIEGPEILRVQETLTVHYTVDNIRCSGFQGMISYDKSKMLLIDAAAYNNTWNVEVMPSGLFLAYSKTPIDENSFFNGGRLFSLTFSLKGEVQPSDILDIQIGGVLAVVVSVDGDSEVAVPDTEYSKQVDPPASENADLSELSVAGVSFSPAFSPDVTEYKVAFSVDYNITSLDLSLKTAHHRASYEISGNELRVGNNTVVITVRAENGNTKEYKINVKRAHDPLQPLSSDSRLSVLNVSAGSLSPSFSPDVLSYVLYLPNKTESLDIIATPHNEFAQEIEPMSFALKEGNNLLTITCIAEDSTKSEYVINAYVMPPYSGYVPDIHNKLPLVGVPTVHGELVMGKELLAELTGAAEGSYRVEWYKNGEKVSESPIFKVTKDDVGCVIYAKFIAVGDYYGSFECPRMTLLKSGELVLTDRHIAKNTGVISLGILIIIIVFCAALFLSTGVAIGIKKRGLVAEDKKADIHN